jgi:hypothetical protein
VLSCFSVRNSSNVDTVLGSHFTVPIRLQTWSFSKLMKSVHPLKQERHITGYRLGSRDHDWWVGGYQSFGGTCRLHHQGKHAECSSNVANHLQSVQWHRTTDLSPQGSFSAIRSTSRAILGSSSAGSSTSPQDSWADFAALSSSSSRLARA